VPEEKRIIKTNQSSSYLEEESSVSKSKQDVIDSIVKDTKDEILRLKQIELFPKLQENRN